MSETPFFFQKENKSSHSSQQEASRVISPDFTLIDDRSGKSRYTYFNADASQQSRQFFAQEIHLKFSNYAFFLRLICLLGFFFCLVLGTGIFLLFSLIVLCAALFLFQNRSFNQSVRSFGKIGIHAFVAAFGFLLGIFNPKMGLGLLAFYFSLANHLVKV